jgi:hypothetical protein
MKFIGPLIILLGFVFLGVSLFDFLNTSGFESPKYFGLGFVGMPLIFIGFITAGPQIQRFLLRRNKESIRESMKIIGEGLREGLNVSDHYCSNCGHNLEQTANFCQKCGKAKI